MDGLKQKKKKARVEKEQPTKEEISLALSQIVDRQKQLIAAREQFWAETSRVPKKFSGTCIIPRWNISPESSIMKTRAGEDSLELYQVVILPMDQVTLGSMPDTKLEEIAAHDLMWAANVAHNLTLRSHHWRVRCLEAEAQVKCLEQEKEAISAKTMVGYESHIELMRTKLLELDTRAKNSEESLRAANNEEARLKGAKDFKDSPIFTRLVVEKAAEFEVMGFYKCQSHLQKFGGFKPDFDPSKLDLELDGSGERASLDERRRTLKAKSLGSCSRI
ncbi:hypothetical protein DH2020_021829 [Rehmannia glutinosa]|uniref:Uncharacterized protein n=1 Tax=Rehmannia glutinosa TaxID=99300 RepID=A0ABR0WG12_REHGL